MHLIALIGGLAGLVPENILLIPSFTKHVLPEILLPQIEAKVAVIGKIALGISLETPPNGSKKVGL